MRGLDWKARERFQATAGSRADAWDALNEKTGDEEMSLAYAEYMTSQAKNDLAKAKKAKVKQSADLDEFIANESARKQAIADAEQTLVAWADIAGEPGRRKAEAEEGRVKAEEQATSAHGITNNVDDIVIADKHRISEELDDNGLPFLLSSNDSVEFGKIRESDGIPSLPIRLSEGYNKKTEDGRNIGYGYDHIKEGHGDQILKAGFSSVLEFIEYVSSNYQKISRGQTRKNGSQTYIIEVVDNKSNVLYIEISQDGQYWTINSGGVFRKGYTKNKELVEPLPAVEASPVAADDKVQEQSDNPMSGNSISTNPSNGKVSDSLPNKQEADGKSSENGAITYGETYSHDGGAFQVENTPVIVDGREIGLKSVMTGRGKQTTEFVMHVPYEIDSEVGGRKVESDDNGESILKFDSAEEMAEFWKRNDVAKAIEEALKETEAKQTPVDNTVTDPQKLSEAVKERGGELEDGDIDFEVGKSYPLADGGKMMVTAINGWEVTARVYDKDGKLQRTMAEPARALMRLTDEDFERIEDIVENYDNVTVESGKRGGNNIIYSKSYPDGTTIFVEEQRTGRMELAAVTMWKHKKSTLTDAKSTETPQISDLGATSEHKVNTSGSDKQAGDAKSSKKSKQEPKSKSKSRKKPANRASMEEAPMPADEWLLTQPEDWRSIEEEAIFECMKKGWELHIMNIQSTAREIDAKRNPKGW